MDSNQETSLVISNILFKIGVPFNMYGTKYLARAVDIAVSNSLAVNQITKGIYRPIAQEFGTKEANVERSIRNAVDKAWKNPHKTIIGETLGIDVNCIMDRPTNAQLIALIAERIPYVMSKQSLEMGQ